MMTGYPWLCTQELVLQTWETKWHAGIQTWVGHEQNKCPMHCVSSDALCKVSKGMDSAILMKENIYFKNC